MPLTEGSSFLAAGYPSCSCYDLQHEVRLHGYEGFEPVNRCAATFIGSVSGILGFCSGLFLSLYER
jgi:hypothetical protein